MNRNAGAYCKCGHRHLYLRDKQGFTAPFLGDLTIVNPECSECGCLRFDAGMPGVVPVEEEIALAMRALKGEWGGYDSLAQQVLDL